MKKENLLLTALIILVFVMGFFIGKNYNNPYGSEEGMLDFNNKDLVSFFIDSDYYSFYLKKCKQK